MLELESKKNEKENVYQTKYLFTFSLTYLCRKKQTNNADTLIFLQFNFDFTKMTASGSLYSKKIKKFSPFNPINKFLVQNKFD